MDADLTRETFGGVPRLGERCNNPPTGRAARGVIPRAPDPPILAGPGSEPESEVAGDLPRPKGEVTG